MTYCLGNSFKSSKMDAKHIVDSNIQLIFVVEILVPSVLKTIRKKFENESFMKEYLI